ncbi:MAG TPA: class II fructose-bisphosphate aldolase [Candidatus Paceibacterota bacterium]
MTLNQILGKALKEGWSTGHFNISELDHMRAIIETCAKLRSPAIIGTSEGERKHIGLLELVALRDVFRKEFDIPIFLNADHTKSVSAAKEAIDAGYDSIHIDLSALPFEENIAGTKEIVEYAKGQGASSKGQEINIEGELGYLRGESKIQKEKIIISKDDYTKPEEAKEFAERTGVDRLGVAVGNIHGLSPEEPDLNIDLISNIRKACPANVVLVLHGGSGIKDEQIKDAIKSGISNVHINTDLRKAFVEGLKESIEKNPDEVAMYKLDKEGIERMKEVVKQKLTLFGSVNRI